MLDSGFQSIGVTKDWRPRTGLLVGRSSWCFQSIGVTKDWRPSGYRRILRPGCDRFQSIGVTKDWRLSIGTEAADGVAHGFPINRRHQGLATLKEQVAALIQPHQGFQSIGVTKDWRRGLRSPPKKPVHGCGGFQSIGVTKDWRQALIIFGARLDTKVSNQ